MYNKINKIKKDKSLNGAVKVFRMKYPLRVQQYRRSGGAWLPSEIAYANKKTLLELMKSNKAKDTFVKYKIIK